MLVYEYVANGTLLGALSGTCLLIHNLTLLIS